MSEHLTTREALEELLEDLIRESPGLVVLFTDAGCQVADAVEPKLAALLRQEFPALRFTVVSRSDSRQLLTQMGVLAFPTVIVFFAGKETARFTRAFSLDEVAQAIERPYGLLFGP
ncbi:MAG: thioredoxin family protein [Archangium sp.]|nr:thioredoxin family protein [Archangium sp.]